MYFTAFGLYLCQALTWFWEWAKRGLSLSLLFFFYFETFISCRVTLYQRGRGGPKSRKLLPPPKKANQINGTETYFSDGICKRGLCTLKNLLQPTNRSKGKGKWKEIVKREGVRSVLGGRRGFSNGKICILRQRSPSGSFWYAVSPEGLGVSSKTSFNRISLRMKEDSEDLNSYISYFVQRCCTQVVSLFLFIDNQLCGYIGWSVCSRGRNPTALELAF